MKPATLRRALAAIAESPLTRFELACGPSALERACTALDQGCAFGLAHKLRAGNLHVEGHLVRSQARLWLQRQAHL